ncbi:MAG: alkylated DNA repair protein (DNA oxidative demethylase) [Granulosicoccus sp.]
MKSGDLFSNPHILYLGMTHLPKFVDTGLLRPAIETILSSSPLRRMETQRGHFMSVETSNCGSLGWVSDRRGYRYAEIDPLTGEPWPVMPELFKRIAEKAAMTAGFPKFRPDSCLINYYVPGTQMGAHQDKDEKDFSAPIVSVSMGIDARFFVLGPERRGTSTSVDLSDGDVVVFGGASRLFFHGVRKLKTASHEVFGASRWNLTFRKAG